MFDCSKSKGNDFWFEESGVSNNRIFEKSGFHCKNRVLLSQALMRDRFPRKFDVQTSYEPSNVIFVVNIKFPRAAYHAIVPSSVV